jgi:ferredoxin--NADP+ reductase
VKFTKKEMETVAINLDLKALDSEFERTGPIMEAVGQDSGAAKAFILSSLDKAEPKVSDTRFSLDFLASPGRLLGDENGRVRGVEVSDTTLEMREGGGTKAVNLNSMRVIEADTVVFCIGDRVDASMGLPLDKWGEFAKHPKPAYPIGEKSYEAYDPESKQTLEGVFLAGWSREASSGLVGTARKDGNSGAKAVMAFLEKNGNGESGAIEKLESRLTEKTKLVVRESDLKKLEGIELAKATELGLEEFKYSTNDEMLSAMDLKKQKEGV